MSPDMNVRWAYASQATGLWYCYLHRGDQGTSKDSERSHQKTYAKSRLQLPAHKWWGSTSFSSYHHLLLVAEHGENGTFFTSKPSGPPKREGWSDTLFRWFYLTSGSKNNDHQWQRYQLRESAYIFYEFLFLPDSHIVNIGSSNVSFETSPPLRALYSPRDSKELSLAGVNLFFFFKDCIANLCTMGYRIEKAQFSFFLFFFLEQLSPYTTGSCFTNCPAIK